MMAKPKTLTPAEKKAQAKFLKSKGMTLAQWHAKTSAAWAAKNPDKVQRKGIGNTIADVTAVRNSLWSPAIQKAAMDRASAEATQAGNADLEGLPDATKIQSDAGQMASVIKGFGDNLFTQLGNVQTANANAANDGISLFKNDRANADQAAAAQIIAAGGGVPQTGPTAPVEGTPSLPNSLPGTTATSTAPRATASLVNLAANANNVFGARSYAAGQQELLDQRQNQNDLKKSLYQLQENKDQIRERAAANAISLFNRERDQVEGNIPNYLNYSLYNTNDTAKNDLAKTKLKQDKTLAGQKLAETKAYHAAMQSIAQQNANTKRWLADGTYTPKSAALASKGASVISTAFNKYNGSGGTAGSKVFRVPYSLPGVPTGQYDPSDPSKPILTKKKGVYEATPQQMEAFKKSFKKDAQGNPIPGTGNMGVFGLQGATRTGDITPATKTGTAGAKWTTAQVKTYLVQSKLLGPEQIKAVLAALTDPAKAAKLLADPNFFLSRK